MRSPHPTSKAAAQALFTALVALAIALGFARSDSGPAAHPVIALVASHQVVLAFDGNAQAARPATAAASPYKFLDDDDDDGGTIDRRPSCVRPGRRARPARWAALTPSPFALPSRRAPADLGERAPFEIRLASRDVPSTHGARGPPRA
jgi:hypothetical protein